MSLEDEDAAINALLESIAGLSSAEVSTRIGNFRGMLYGNDGVGKTIAGLALLNHIVEPDKSILLLDTADNGLSLNNHPGLKTKLSDGTDRIKRYSYKGEAWLHAVAAACERQIAPFDRVGGVQFDELSTMSDGMLAVILKAAEERDKSRPQDDATWPEYKMLLRKMKNITNRFAQVEGVHTIGIAHIRADKGAFNRNVESPNFTPAVGREIRKPMHLIANVTVTEGGERRFRVTPTDEIVAKCKIGGLGPVVGFPQLATSLGEWLGGKGKTVEEQTIEHTPQGNDNESNDEGWTLQ